MSDRRNQTTQGSKHGASGGVFTAQPQPQDPRQARQGRHSHGNVRELAREISCTSLGSSLLGDSTGARTAIAQLTSTTSAAVRHTGRATKAAKHVGHMHTDASDMAWGTQCVGHLSDGRGTPHN